MPGPMCGVKVLDFTIMVNGPSATMKLADAGAEVLKVEPMEGSLERLDLANLPDGFNPIHGHVNRGKRSMALDMKHPRALEIAEGLVKWADVLTSNFRPGVLDKLGLTYEQCRAWNPRLIYTTNSGFGPAGDWAKAPAFDGVAQGFSGLLFEQGGGPTKGTPTLTANAFSDEVGAMNYCNAILMALFAREKTGLGQRLDTSLLGASVSFQHISLTPALHEPDHPQRDDGEAPGGAFTHLCKCQDGLFLVTLPVNEKQWAGFCRAIERPDLYELTMQNGPEGRKEHQMRVKAEVKKVMRTRPRDEWIQRLLAEDVPAGPANTYKDVASMQHFRDNGYIQEAEIPGFGKRVIIGTPNRFSETPVEIRAAAPELAQDTEYYLKRVLGYGDDEIAQLACEKAILPPRPGGCPRAGTEEDQLRSGSGVGRVQRVLRQIGRAYERSAQICAAGEAMSRSNL